MAGASGFLTGRAGGPACQVAGGRTDAVVLANQALKPLM